MKIVLYGMPGTGKTTLLREVFRLWSEEGLKPHVFQYGLLRGEVYKKPGLEDIWVPGVFQNSTYDGTDKLSMGVQPHAVKFVQVNKKLRCVLLEGERLFKVSFFNELKPDKVFILSAAPEILKARYAERQSDQSPTWLKGRATAIENVKAAFPSLIEIIKNETMDDLKVNALALSKLCISALQA